MDSHRQSSYLRIINVFTVVITEKDTGRLRGDLFVRVYSYDEKDRL